MKKKFSSLKSFIELTEGDAKRIRGGYDDDGGGVLTRYDSKVTTYSDTYPGPAKDTTTDTISDYKSGDN